MEQKICINCEMCFSPGIVGPYFCKLFWNPDDVNYLVTGGERAYEFCTVARLSNRMCGKEGRHYIAKGDKKDEVSIKG